MSELQQPGGISIEQSTHSAMDWDTGGSGDEKMAKVAEARMSLDHII